MQKMKSYQIIPDRSISNGTIDKLVDGFSLYYQNLVQRLREPQNYFVWEVEISRSDVKFILTAPDHFDPGIISGVWNKTTIRKINEVNFPYKEAVTLKLRNHYFFSLSTDHRSNEPLPGILETQNLNCNALVQVVIVPISPDWYYGYDEAYEKYKQGECPGKLDLSSLPRHLAECGARVGIEIMNTITELVTEQEPEPINFNKVTRHKELSAATLNKGKYNAFDVTIRLAADKKEAVRMLTTAFKGVTSDNELVPCPVFNMPGLLESIQQKKAPLKINRDILSVPELGRLLQLPPASLQSEYKMGTIEASETRVPVTMARGGINIGNVTYKGVVFSVYWDTKNLDELCLPRVVVGGMGTGKSKGFGANFAIDCARLGYSCFLIDVTDGELGDLVRDSVPEVSKIVDLNYGDVNHPIPLSWNEMAIGGRSREVANVLSSQLVNFLSKFSTEAGERTERYLRAAGKVVFNYVQNPSIMDVMLFLLSKKYRQEVQILDPRLAEIWKDFDSMSDGLRSQIVGPVMNRLDAITGNEYLANCVFQKPDPRINFRKWADEGKIVILRVPKSILWDDCTDAMVTFLISKLWLSILTRFEIPGHLRRPAFLVLDEPHQYLGSAKGGIKSTWGSMMVESRKWRFSPIFMFHDFGQIPGDLRGLLKSSGSHYTLYSSSKETFRALEEEIRPFTIEEAMEIKTHHALNVVRHDGKVVRFMAAMQPPPKIIRNNNSCIDAFGRDLDIVEREIFDKERILIYN